MVALSSRLTVNLWKPAAMRSLLELTRQMLPS
jgi:hypothetical protein